MQLLRQQKSPKATDDLYSLACGPDNRVTQYTDCIVNGIRQMPVSLNDDESDAEDDTLMDYCTDEEEQMPCTDEEEQMPCTDEEEQMPTDDDIDIDS
ncbi:hypothetical protein MRB53_013898 [Persea americana]|uniref:Uncharacterized protein n=1 Tax=Persea americana TaxID=3435 RepID=A0ACC2K9C5_PERAE|nr:hypothetical protein MRB53_013898 [Persea americana]